MQVTRKEFALLQARLDRMVDCGFISIKALEQEAEVSNGTINRIRKADPDSWVRHPTTRHELVPLLNNAVDTLIIEVNKAK